MLAIALHLYLRRRRDHQRSGSLVAVVAVGMVHTGIYVTVVIGQQHDEVGDKVGQGRHAVDHQALGFGQHARDDLGARQHQVDEHADLGTARGRPLCGRVLVGFRVFGGK